MTSKSIVKLNIGGKVFQTTKSTLTKFDGFFKTLIETDIPVETDESGYIFIDRSPKHFDLILNYMRDGDVTIPNNEQEVQEIQKEAQYYLLLGLMELCTLKSPAVKPDLPVKLRMIGSDTEMFNILANITDKPVIIVSCCVGLDGLTYVPWRFGFVQFLEKWKDRFEIYFKTCNQLPVQDNGAFNRSSAGSTAWKFAIYDKLGLQHQQNGWMTDVQEGIMRFFDNNK